MAFQTRLLDALLDPNLSLRGVAQRLGLPLDQLSLILARPDLAGEIAALDSLAATRTRLVATSLLPAAAQSARQVVDEFNQGDSDCPRETALRATRILLRLANFASGPVVPRISAPRAPRSFQESAPQAAAPAPRPFDAASIPPLVTGLQPPARGAAHEDVTSDRKAPAEFQRESQAKVHAPKQVQDVGQEQANDRARALSTEQAKAESADLPADACDIDNALAADDALEAEDALARAARLISSGAFTPSDLDAAYRLAASERAKCDQMESDLHAELDDMCNSDDEALVAFAELLRDELKLPPRQQGETRSQSAIACAPP